MRRTAVLVALAVLAGGCGSTKPSVATGTTAAHGAKRPAACKQLVVAANAITKAVPLALTRLQTAHGATVAKQAAALRRQLVALRSKVVSAKANAPPLRNDKLRLLADIDGLAGALGKLERMHATKAPETLPGASQLTQIASDVQRACQAT